MKFPGASSQPSNTALTNRAIKDARIPVNHGSLTFNANRPDWKTRINRAKNRGPDPSAPTCPKLAQKLLPVSIAPGPVRMSTDQDASALLVTPNPSPSQGLS